MDNIIIGKSQLDKHSKYKKSYKNNDIFFGLGIENEKYLEFEKKINFSKDNFLKNRRRERYSVDYNSNYKEDVYFSALNKFVQESYNEELPLLLNSHSFTHTDCKNNSITLYTKKCEPNPKYLGETLFDKLFNHNLYFKNEYQKSFTFDGDTIEIITNNFYNTSIDETILELSKNSLDFIYNLQRCFKELDIFPEYGKINFMKVNHPFAIHMTNLNNMAIFNNGTLHFNITLPTQLDDKGLIKDKESFIFNHKNLIKLIQVVEPLLMLIYGSPDFLHNFDDNKLFSASSQRCAISRYIGIGTYDTDKMLSGKMLVDDINLISCNKLDYWWFHKYYEKCAYNKLNIIGYDINFNKHYNHGVEIRFFDHIEDLNKIREVFEFFIFLADFVLDENNKNDLISLKNPILDKTWNNIVYKIFIDGKNTVLNDEEIIFFNNVFNYKFSQKKAFSIFYEIYTLLFKKYYNNGIFSDLCITKYLSHDNDMFKVFFENIENSESSESDNFNSFEDIIDNINIAMDINNVDNSDKLSVISNISDNSAISNYSNNSKNKKKVKFSKNKKKYTKGGNCCTIS